MIACISVTHVHKQEVRHPTMLIDTVDYLLSQGAYSTDSIGGIGLLIIGCRKAEKDLIKEVVNEEHLCSWVTIGPIDAAIESSVRHVEWRFPDISEFCQTGEIDQVRRYNSTYHR